jgi:hypothetical protein
MVRALGTGGKLRYTAMCLPLLLSKVVEPALWDADAVVRTVVTAGPIHDACGEIAS